MKTPSKPRVRKPYKVIRVNDPHANHCMDSRLILEIYPNGLIYLREHGRRTRREIGAARVYEYCIRRDIASMPRRRRAMAKAA